MNVVRCVMALLLFIFSFLCIQQSSAQSYSHQSHRRISFDDLIALRSCAHSVSKLIDGTKVMSDWSSSDEKSFYFLKCEDNYELGDDHYVFTPTGVYYFFLKKHTDYKGGAEPTQFRLSLENKTYYFVTDITARLDRLYDQKGVALYAYPDELETPKLDISKNNAALKFYLKIFTGKTDSTASVIANPLPIDRIEKAHSCIRKSILKMGSSLEEVFAFQLENKLIEPGNIQLYRNVVKTALSAPACTLDSEINIKFNAMRNSL